MKKLFLTAVIAASALPAFAHHPLAGQPMETFTHGVLSGIGHPILGFDHLFFIALVGLAAIFTTRAMLAPLGFIAAMLAGTMLASFGATLPAVEIMIVVSLIILGAIVAAGRGLAFIPALALFAVAGVFHGAAFGATIAAQESAVGGAVLFGYLLGLGVTQYLIAIGRVKFAKRFGNHHEPRISLRVWRVLVLARLACFYCWKRASLPFSPPLGLDNYLRIWRKKYPQRLSLVFWVRGKRP